MAAMDDRARHATHAILRGGLKALLIVFGGTTIGVLASVAGWEAHNEFEWRVLASGAAIPLMSWPTFAFPLMVVAWHDELPFRGFRIFGRPRAVRPNNFQLVLFLAAAVTGICTSFLLFSVWLMCGIPR